MAYKPTSMDFRAGKLYLMEISEMNILTSHTHTWSSRIQLPSTEKTISWWQKQKWSFNMWIYFSLQIEKYFSLCQSRPFTTRESLVETNHWNELSKNNMNYHIVNFDMSLKMKKPRLPEKVRKVKSFSCVMNGKQFSILSFLSSYAWKFVLLQCCSALKQINYQFQAVVLLKLSSFRMAKTFVRRLIR